MKTSFNTASSSPILAKVRPLDQIRARPYSFVGLAIAAGMAAGLFFKIRTLRTGLKWYLAARRLL